MVEIKSHLLKQAYDYDWYYPYRPSSETLALPEYQRAVEEGWHEWIESDLDVAAIKQGYKYDVSRDLDGNPCCFLEGKWVLHDGTEVEVEDEQFYIGHCGAGDAYLRFCETFLCLTKGLRGGEQYRFIPWARKLSTTVMGWVDDKGNRRFRHVVIFVPKKNAKLLSDDTPIPTPTGWTTHGQLKVGDEIFAGDGSVCKVIAVHPKDVANRKVEFTNGEVIYCNDDHLWVTETLKRKSGTSKVGPTGYYPAEPRTTKEIRETLKMSAALSHRIKLHEGLQLPEVEFEVDPWLLGYWLGDGTSSCGNFTIHPDDVPNFVSRVEKLGYECRVLTVKNKTARTVCVYGLVQKLKRLGVVNNKHIPRQYLRGSFEQRLALVKGLMDSDGTIDQRGTRCSFNQKTIRIPVALRELLASIGIKSSIVAKSCICTTTKKRSTTWQVSFAALKDTHPVFTLPRKLARMREKASLQMATGRSRHVHIKSITDSEPVSGNCITVSSADGTYLAGKTMIPTHNSALMSNFAIYMLAFDGTKRAQVYGAACDRNQARIIYDDAASMVKSSPVLEDIIHVIDSKSRLVHQASGSFYVVLSADAHRNEGIDASCVLVDEIHVHPNRKLYSVLKRAGQARPNPLMFVISTVGPTLDESIWAELFKEGKAQLAGERPDSIHHYTLISSAAPIKIELKEPAKQGDTVLHVNRLEQPVDVEEIEFELVERKVRVKIAEPAKRFQDFLVIEPLESDLSRYSQAEANKQWDTDHAIIRANPSVGFTFQLERLRQEIKDARSPAALAEMQQLNLNIVSGVGKGIVSQAAWQACGELPFDTSGLAGKHCYGGADISFKNDLTSFSLAFPNWDPWVKFGNVQDPMVHTLNWSWVPEENIQHREELEQVAYRMYSKLDYVIPGKGCIRLCKGSVIDYAQVASEITDICQLYKVKAIALDPNYSQFISPLLEQAGLTVVAHRQNAMHMSPPIKRFAEIVHKTQLAHGKHPLLTQSIANAVLTTPDASGNQMLAKTKSHGRIDPLVATVMAVGFATNPPVADDQAYSDASTGMWG